MDALIVAVAQYALFVVAAGGLLAWWLADRGDKIALGVQAVLAVALVAVLVKAAGLVHVDPRPFVVNPSLRPLFPHPPDNGFPSDHTALAAAVSLLVLRYRTGLGAALLAVTVAIGAARVAAHVHHVEDIAAGLLIGALATGVALAGWAVWRRLGPRETGVRSENTAG
jgi:undecaprenyl-diphosphatase